MTKLKITIPELGLCFSCILWAVGILILGMDDAVLNGCMIIPLYIFSIACIFSANDKKVYPFVFFMLYCFASNAGQTLTHLLNIENDSYVDIYSLYPHELIGQMLLLQGIFVLFMTIGYLAIRRRQDVSACVLPCENKGGDKVGVEELILIAVALFVFYTYWDELAKRGSLSYGEYYYESRESLGTVMQYVYHVLMFAYIMRHKGWKRKAAYTVFAVLAFMAVLIGSRSNTLPLLVGCAFMITASHRDRIKIKLRYWVLALAVLWIFAGFSEIRNYAISELSFGLLADVYLTSPLRALADILIEMGSSARTVLTTMKALEINAVERGGTILYAALKGIFPIRILSAVGINPPPITELSAWVSHYGGGEGWGYSIIAEIIYNFGGWGFIFSLIFGAVVAWLENIMEKLLLRGDIHLAAGILYTLGYMAFLARAEAALVATRMRYTVYLALVILLINLFNSKRKKTL